MLSRIWKKKSTRSYPEEIERLKSVLKNADAPKPVYDDLLRLVQDKDYFVITTNVDHCFQKAGFDKNENLKVVFLELGVGMNTPVIIKFRFHDAVVSNKFTTYVCVNLFEATAPEVIKNQAICLAADVLADLV